MLKTVDPKNNVWMVKSYPIDLLLPQIVMWTQNNFPWSLNKQKGTSKNMQTETGRAIMTGSTEEGKLG
jgi:hypothetical protein